MKIAAWIAVGFFRLLVFPCGCDFTWRMGWLFSALLQDVFYSMPPAHFRNYSPVRNPAELLLIVLLCWGRFQISQSLTNAFFGDVLTIFIIRLSIFFPDYITLIDFTLNFDKYSCMLYCTSCNFYSSFCTFIWGFSCLFFLVKQNYIKHR